LFLREDPDEVDDESLDWRSNLNPESLRVNTAAMLEPALANASVGDQFQFERLGYFCVDRDSAPEALVFNRTVTLKDAWAKQQARS
ncbi:MAG: glutamine--tRNA ligase, partial [Planctomycetaceae bacterium]|nr:glutamine--tRNA ligase [Planctomycetaceae bacterium]